MDVFNIPVKFFEIRIISFSRTKTVENKTGSHFLNFYLSVTSCPCRATVHLCKRFSRAISGVICHFGLHLPIYVGHPISSNISETNIKIRILLPVTWGHGCCLLMFEI